MVIDSQRPSEETEAPRARPCGGSKPPPAPAPAPAPPMWRAGIDAEVRSCAELGPPQPSRRKRSPSASLPLLLGRVAVEGAPVKGPKGMPANAWSSDMPVSR